MLNDLNKLKSNALTELGAISDANVLEDWRISYLGRKGRLTQILRGLSTLPIEERKAVGAVANDIKALLESELDKRQQAIKEAKLAGGTQAIDVTLPGRPIALGRLHPTTQIVRQICDAFTSMGFEVVEGPEVESDYYNFEALNIPKDHPARDMWDTIWISRDEANPSLLRTHTSPMQVRVMEKCQPPVRVVVPGRCYRYEATDATHESIFFQIEGLAVDKGITFTDLKGTLYEFAKCLFGAERKVRFRCDYFPFVEPGLDMSIDCFVCGGKGCRLCSDTGWIEILGAGMVHPNVLRGVGYDPNIYTGFAFGIGVERILMLKHGIDDIRLFYGNDLRFLRQF
ncbi:phenylalanine--tRNA ligase subunit alpha [Chloroflexota bacterium]